MKIAYVTELYDEKMSYRENILCKYLMQNNVDLDIFYARGSEKVRCGIKCKSVRIFGLVFYFSTKFLRSKYDYILVSDLRQPSSIIFIFIKLFANSKIIIEHEQRSFGTTTKGRILSFFMYLFSYVCYARANLIRSPNSYSTRYLKYFPRISRKILELPLAVCMDEFNEGCVDSLDKGDKLKIFWSGKRFLEKCGTLLSEYVEVHTDAELTVVTNESLNFNCNRVLQTKRLLDRSEFGSLAKQHDLAIYLSPTQSFYEVAALGIPVMVASNALPRCNPKYLRNFIPVPFCCDEQGNVRQTAENRNILELAIERFGSDRSLRLIPAADHVVFEAPCLWRYYESS